MNIIQILVDTLILTALIFLFQQLMRLVVKQEIIILIVAVFFSVIILGLVNANVHLRG